MLIHSDIIQGSEEWYEIRLGKVTASKFKDVMAEGDGISRKKYMRQLVAETLTGCSQVTYRDKNMEMGTEFEPLARQHYEAVMGVAVRQVGFISRNDDVGVSPDGLVGDNGMIEIKCPLTTTLIDYILADKFPTTYRAQVQGQLWVAERQWCDFVAFDPRMKSNKMFRVRVERDDKYIEIMEEKINFFVEQLKDMCNQFKSPF